VFTGTIWGKIVYHGIEFRERGTGIGPDIGPMGLLVARLEHGHRSFICMQHGLLVEPVPGELLLKPLREAKRACPLRILD
jgi:hypothetical protein